MTFEPGQAVRWYRSTGTRRTVLIDAVVVRRLTSQSIVVKVDGQEYTVRAENLMPAAVQRMCTDTA